MAFDPNDLNKDQVENLMKAINPEKSNGPDDIHPAILNKLSRELAKPLTGIFRSSLLSGEVPNDWKMLNVTPIYKKGSKVDPKNYRPISLTSQECRIFERAIKKEMVK